MRHVTDTGRTAIHANGRTEKVFEVWHDEGIFAGVVSEVLESELSDRERETIKNTARLEELRAELRAERISYGELAELQGLVEFIDPGDVELLEAAGVPEHA